MVFRKIKQWLGLDTSSTVDEEPQVSDDIVVDTDHVDAQQMDEWFGQLRSMLHKIPVDDVGGRAFADELLAFLQKAYKGSPEIYMDQWRPYLNGFDLAPLYNLPLFGAIDRADLIMLNTLLPDQVTRRYSVTINDDADALACAEDDALRHVTSLTLNINALGDAGREALLNGPNFEKVDFLTIDCGQLLDLGDLATSWPGTIHRLFLRKQNLQLAHLKAWRASGKLEQMSLLMLFDMTFERDELVCLFEGTSYPNLTDLSFSNFTQMIAEGQPQTTQYGDDLLSLLSHCDLPCLTSLSVENMSVTGQGLEQLLLWKGLSHLNHLRLGFNLFNEDDALAFIEQGQWHELDFMILKDIEFSSSTQQLLVSHPNLPSGLEIVYGKFDDDQDKYHSLIVD